MLSVHRKIQAIVIAALFLLIIAIAMPALGEKYTVDISSYDTFRAATMGNPYICDNGGYVQCWDGAALLWQQIGETLSTGGTKKVCNCWLIESVRNSNAGTNFILIYNFADVRRGDVVVMSATTDNPNGHICFADEDYNGTGTMNIYGQNQDGISAFSVLEKSNMNQRFLGAFRYKRWSGGGIQLWGVDNKSAWNGMTTFRAKRDDNNSNHFAIFYIDDVPITGHISADSNGFFSVSVDTTKYSKGPHMLSIYYENSDGTWWDMRNIIFGSSSTNTNIQIWNLEGGSTHSGTVRFWAKRSDSDSNHYASFYLDNNRQITGHMSADSNGYFSAEIDTTQFSDGPHKLIIYYENSSSCGMDYTNIIFKNVTSSSGIQLWGIEDLDTVSGEVTFRAKRADTNSIHYGIFYIDDGPITGHISADQDGFFTTTVNTAKYSVGYHRLSIYYEQSNGSGWDLKEHVFFYNHVIGTVNQISSDVEQTIHLKGWAIDPDDPSNTQVELAVFVGGDKDSGRRYTAHTNGLPNTGADNMGYGVNHGFELDVEVEEIGRQPIYVYGVDALYPTLLVRLYNGNITINGYQPTGITIRESLILEEGGTALLSPEFIPSNTHTAYRGVTWSSSNTSIAVVSSDGVVTGVQEGITTITATSVYSPEFSASCTVTVRKTDTPPLVGLMTVSAVTPQNYTVVCNASDDFGLVKAQFLSWTDDEGESNAFVQEVTVDNNTANTEFAAVISVSDHGYATNIYYNTKVLVFDDCGNVSEYAGESVRVYIPELIYADLKVILPSDLQVIEENAFENSTDIGEVVIPDGLKQICSRAFANCSSLVLIHMPDSIEEIGTDAFAGCQNVIFLCASNNAAAVYARENGIPYFTGE